MSEITYPHSSCKYCTRHWYGCWCQPALCLGDNPTSEIICCNESECLFYEEFNS